MCRLSLAYPIPSPPDARLRRRWWPGPGRGSARAVYPVAGRVRFAVAAWAAGEAAR